MKTELMQSPAFAAALTALGVRTRALQLAKCPPVQMVVRDIPALGRAAMISRVTGPPADLRDAARASGIAALVLSPAQPAGAACRDAGFFPLFTPAYRAIAPLHQDPEVQTGRQRQKWRNRLHHAQRSRLVISRVAMPTREAGWVFDANDAQARRKGYRPLPRCLIEAYATQAPDDVCLFEARLGGQPVAGMIFARHAQCASYLIGHNTAEGRRRSAHNLLLWEAMRWLACAGVELLDLGMLDTVNAPGLARFKLGSGAVAQSLGGTWLHAPGLNLIARALPRALLV